MFPRAEPSFQLWRCVLLQIQLVFKLIYLKIDKKESIFGSFIYIIYIYIFIFWSVLSPPCTKCSKE